MVQGEVDIVFFAAHFEQLENKTPKIYDFFIVVKSRHILLHSDSRKHENRNMHWLIDIWL